MQKKKVLMLVRKGDIYILITLINKMKNFKFIIITDQRGKVYYESFFQNKSLILEYLLTMLEVQVIKK